MKSAALIALTLTGASAFMRPAPLPRARGALSMSLASVELEAGKCAPFVDGFDPLNLASDKDFKTLKKWRESELKHGRVAMLAVLGIAVQENFHPLFGFGGKEMDAAIYHFQEIQNRFPLFWTGLVLAIGLVEAQGIAKGWDQGYGVGSSGIAGVREDYINGDLGFDPIGFVRDNDEEKFIEWRTKELNNGRLAMIAALGLAVQEKLVTQGLPEFEISRFQ